MLDLILGFTITIISLLIGFSIGKYNTIVSPDFKKQITQIYRKVIPDTDIGPVERLTKRELDIINDPKKKQEYEEMDRTLGKLNQ